MIDKYQIYTFYRTLKKIWNAKRFNTITVHTLMDESYDDIIINQTVDCSPRIEFMANYAIKLVNELNSNILSFQEWIMYFLTKCLINNTFYDIKDVNTINKLNDSKIFTNRQSINTQIKYINNIIQEKNQGINEFTDTKFTLYQLDNEQYNNAYILYKNNKLDPEFFIQGILHNKFKLNKSVIKDIDYLKFITICELIIKAYKENSTKKS